MAPTTLRCAWSAFSPPIREWACCGMRMQVILLPEASPRLQAYGCPWKKSKVKRKRRVECCGIPLKPRDLGVRSEVLVGFSHGGELLATRNTRGCQSSPRGSGDAGTRDHSWRSHADPRWQ